MTALHLDCLTWPEIKEEIQNGRVTVIVPFGSTEQHGRHMPLGTDAVLGDVFGWGLAERLDAFLAPTVRYGCSEHHLAFSGTISLNEDTFQRIVMDIVTSLSRHGFRRIVLLPTHGGNFKPLAEAMAKIKPVKGVRVLAFTDLAALVDAAFKSSKAFNVEVNELPLSMVLSWYEQKAVAILLTLFHLGIKDIRLGPSLPAFITPNVLDVLVKNFNIMPISTPEEDLKAILG